MTTDPDEGRRQIEAMQPAPLKVGDKVRLSAGGERVMTVVTLNDYANSVVCKWVEVVAESFDEAGGMVKTATKHEPFPVRWLVKVDG